MPRRFVLAFVPFGLLLALAPACVPSGPKILSPRNVVRDFSFTIEVQIPSGATFDPASDVTLNGVAVAMTGGPNLYSATRMPGSPLQDVNTLVVHVVSGGNPQMVSREFRYLPPKARAREITDPADLIEGPLAHGRVGDWLIENSVARFIVQDVGQRDLYSVGGFGGNLIDLELVANPGTDNFIEIQPMLNVETVINAQTVEIVNDGQDGTAAILRTCGPDDLLDFVNPSSLIVEAGFSVPHIDDNDQPVEACTEYTLEPLESRVRMDTTVMNLGNTLVRLVVGDWYNPGGQLEQWDKPFRLGEALTAAFNLISFFGYGEEEGVDYGYTTLPLDESIPPLDPPPSGSEVFTTSGVSVVLHNLGVIAALTGQEEDVPFFVDGETTDRRYSRFVSVGSGSPSNGVEMEYAVKGIANGRIEGCISVGGAPAAGARIAVQRTTGPKVESVMTSAAGACPNYSGPLAVDSWRLSAGVRGAPYQDGLAAPTPINFSVSDGVTTTVDVALPATGRLSAHVVDESGLLLPARVMVVGFDPSPPQRSPGPSLPGLGSSTLGLLEDPKEAVPFGIVAFGYSDASGDVAFDVEPGSYQVFVSRGTEYSVYQEPVTISAAPAPPTLISAQIARVLDTTGFVSSDFHVHGIRSADSRVADRPRVSQFAGEGVENIIMTDHHVHTELSPTIADLGLGAWVASTVGEEITTFDYGHFNGYPFTVDPSVPSGGSTDWGKAAPPGMDFPSAGALNATPAEIHALATTGARSTPDTTIQINHIDSHFHPMQIDTSVAGLISDGLDDAERAVRRLPSVAAAGNLFHHFPALELWNGADRAQQENFLLQRIGIWFNHLNKGLRTTAISDTDTHTFGDLESAGARTWTASSSDAVPAISDAEIANAVDAGRAVGGQGLYVQTRLLAGDGSGAVADLTLGGSTDVATSNGEASLEIRVQAPTWARFDSIEVYANGTSAPDAKSEVTSPYLFSAGPPAVTLLEGDCNPATTGGDFVITTVNVHPSVASGMRHEALVTVPFTALTEDTWFVVVVRGSDGVCPPMFPVYPRSLNTASNPPPLVDPLLDGNKGEGGTMALGVTNALYLDVDGNGFEPNP
ncbi:MAG: hypothetical protein ACREI8_13760 [Myxococcota bacterium]